MHYGVIDTWGKYSIVNPPTQVHYWSIVPLYMGTSKSSMGLELKNSLPV
jgi:hypothetical protein